MIEAYKDSIIAVRVGDSSRTDSGVIRTSAEKEQPLTVRIYSSEVAFINKGDLFIIARYSGIEASHEGEEYLFIKESDIIARVRGDK